MGKGVYKGMEREENCPEMCIQMNGKIGKLSRKVYTKERKERKIVGKGVYKGTE
jgi:hypothetical protein